MEWLGEVPGHWELVRYKNVFDEKTSIAGTSHPHGSISFGRVIFKDGEFLHEPTRASYQEVLSGEFLINPINLNYDLKSLRTALSEIDTCVSPAYIVLTAKVATDKNYMKYQLHVFDLFHMKTLGAGVRQTIAFGDIGVCFTCLPPLPEQTLIAAFLDRETTKIDALVGEQRRLMAMLKEKRQAVISHAVTRGLNRDAPMKPSGIEWLGDVPEHWEITKIGYVANVSRGTGYQNVEEIQEGDDAIPMIRISDFNDFAPVWVRNSSSLDVYKVDSNDILIAGTGASAGITMRVTKEMSHMIHSYNAPRIRCQKIDPQFLHYVLNSHGIEQQEALLFSGSAQPFLDLHSISKLELPYCSIVEQIEIVDYLNEQVDMYDALASEAQRAIDLLQERRTALISAAVTGQIDVRAIA